MEAETALTLFCATTVMLIVGLVSMTATQLQIGDSPLLVGNAVAPGTPLGICILPPGFEQKYLSYKECSYGVMNDCSAYCMAGGRDSCVMMSKGRCSLIGAHPASVAGIYRAPPFSGSGYYEGEIFNRD